MTTSAKVIADSISEAGVRITTLELEYPLIIHGELMTHRMFSRNAASNRAIPTIKIIDQVVNNAFIPTYWGMNQPGMQAYKELDEQAIHNSMMDWTEARDDAVYWARDLVRQGVHKQLANRLLMPFQYIKTIVTSTEWDNFFKLRLHKDAQPEIMVLAEHMKKAMDESIPVELQPGEWHLPYISADDCIKTTTDNFVKLSVARCARVSYLNHDNSTPDVEKDIKLADMLLAAGHMSPFEHQATPMRKVNKFSDYDLIDYLHTEGVSHIDKYMDYWSGNFRGWIQYRQSL